MTYLSAPAPARLPMTPACDHLAARPPVTPACDHPSSPPMTPACDHPPPPLMTPACDHPPSRPQMAPASGRLPTSPLMAHSSDRLPNLPPMAPSSAARRPPRQLILILSFWPMRAVNSAVATGLTRWRRKRSSGSPLPHKQHCQSARLAFPSPPLMIKPRSRLAPMVVSQSPRMPLTPCHCEWGSWCPPTYVSRTPSRSSRARIPRGPAWIPQ